ncbi:unnamed protein product [Diamesa serratosioi]
MLLLLTEKDQEDKSEVLAFNPFKLMDPINLPAELREKIFANLGGADLIQCCLVSFQWDNSVRPSVAFKRKVRLAIYPWSDINRIAQHANILNFENISLSNFKVGPEVSFLEPTAWKKATIKINHFPTVAAYMKYLAYFNASVEDLKIVNADIRITGEVKTVEFPFMKALELNNVSATAVQPFVCNQRSLETLNFKCLFESINDPEDKSMMISSIIKMLRQNSGLKSLVLHSDVSNVIFMHDINAITDFKLTNLTLCSDISRAPHNSIQEHMFRFLIEQLKSLETLKLVFRHDVSVQSSYRPILFQSPSPSNKATDFEIIIKIWDHIRKVKKLAIRFMISKTIGEMPRGQRLWPNTSITELHIIFDSHINGKRGCHVMTIVKACPNLQKLRVRYLSNDFFEFLTCYMMKLRLIECYVYATGLEATYNKMKRKDYKVNENIVVVGTERYLSDIQEQCRDIRINY